MSKKKLFKVSALGLAVLGACVAGAVAGQIYPTNKNVAVELINGTSGYNASTPSISIRLDSGVPSGGSLTLTLTNGNFTNSTLYICFGGSEYANANSTLDNNTAVFTFNGSISAGQWVTLVSDNTTCTGNIGIRILPNVNVGDTVTISGIVNATGEVLTATGPIFTIKQQTSAVYEKVKSYIAYDQDLKKFSGGATSSNATLYVKNNNATLNEQASNGNFTIKITGDSFAGVTDGAWGTCTLTFNSDNTTLSNSACPMSNVTDTNTLLTINISGNETLSARKFYTTLKTKADDQKFAREITLLDNVLTHEWVLAGTTFYIPFVRHNAEQNIYTTIKLQARKAGGVSTYPIYAEVVKSDGTTQQVTICGGNLNAGETCTIFGDTLTTAAGKEETMAIISVNAPEEALGCFVVYNYQGQSRRVPCKVKDGKIVE